MKQLQMDFGSMEPQAPEQEAVKVDKPSSSEAAPSNEIEKPKEPHIFSVSELNKGIRRQLESEFSSIWVKGEISNFKAHTSGHFYFSLKDDKAQINAVMFRGLNSRLRFRPKDGMEVMVRGRITVYEPRGNYQIFCEVMDPVGAGALQMAFEQLKAKLKQEGLFDPGRKRPLPALPQHVAIVTSPTGAAIRDMLNVLSRRFKGLRITLIPALVQGDQAPASIVKGLEQANRLHDVDVIICGRGGGSMEDLWAFNDEGVARAVSSSRVPVISAVGHEVDFTISDFVADLRAPTPSAAAELVVKNASDLIEKIEVTTRRLLSAMRYFLDLERKKVEHSRGRLVDPQRRLQDLHIRCDELALRLEGTTSRYLTRRRSELELGRRRLGSPIEKLSHWEQRRQLNENQLLSATAKLIQVKSSRLGRLAAVLDSLSPLKVVDRGYSIVTKEKKIIRDVTQLSLGDEVEIQLARGRAITKVLQLNQPEEVKDGF